MEFYSWFPAVTSSSLLAAALWFGRNLISARLTKSVEHEFAVKLDTLRAQMREAEERLKAELRTKEAEIEALRSGALTAFASRQIALDKRRLEAVDQLWQSITALNPARGIANTMSVINFDKVAPLAEKDEKIRNMFEAISPGFNPNNIDLSGAAKARPFLTPMVWAVYSAMLAVIMHSVMRWLVIKGGLGKNDYSDNNKISDLIKTALPHYSDFVDEHGSSSFYYFIEILESRLLSEIEKMLSGAEADQANLEQSAEILRKSKEVTAQDSPKISMESLI